MADPVPPTFEDLFGVPPDAAADAPGRVNLIGEHTDYHDGYVLPTVIPQRTRVELVRRTDERVRVWSAGVSERMEEYRVGHETPGRGWVDYIQGVTVVLSNINPVLSGFDVRIQSTIPIGGGVSSSAALAVSLLRVLRGVLGLSYNDVALAKLAQSVETDFVGAPVGIMDQMASSLGRDGEALFLDTKTLTFQRIPLPVRTELVAIHSGVTHRHAGGEYAVRRRESFEAAALLGVERLRELTISALPRLTALPAVLARRARHIITENDRVLRAVEALALGDVGTLGALFTASHASMRDDYEVSTSAVDTLVSLGQRDPDVHGARLTGGGFGGAVVMLVRMGMAQQVARRILKEYSDATGNRGVVLVPETTLDKPLGRLNP